MLPHYSPLKVAETFSMLSGIYPGRIDLGIGRAAGTSPRVAHALQRDRRQLPPDDFREQLDELLGYFTPGTRFESAEVSLLGSSGQSGIWAAELGLPYVFADFINAEGSPIAAFYKQRFQSSDRLSAPRVGVCVWAICAESDEEGQRLSASFRMMMTLLYRNQLIAVPEVAKAQAFLEREGIGPKMPPGRRLIAGAPDTVRAAVEAVAAEYGADEVFLVNIMYDHAARRRSYELIADAFGLAGR